MQEPAPVLKSRRAGGLGTTAFTGPQDIKLDRGLEMLIRVTSSGT